MTDRHRSLEFQDRHGHLWQIEMRPDRRLPCPDCGTATEVIAHCPALRGRFDVRRMFIDEAADPQVTVNAVLDWIDEGAPSE